MKVVSIFKDSVEVLSEGEILYYTKSEFKKTFKQEPKKGLIQVSI